MAFVLYFEKEKYYYEALTNLQKNGINPEHKMTPYLIKCSANLGEIEVNGEEILSHPIKPSLLEKMADNVKLVAQTFVAPEKEKNPSGLEGLSWDKFGKGP